MNLMIAATAGAGIGLAFFGGLWVSIRCAALNPGRRGMIVVSGVVRWMLAGFAFFIVSRAGAAAALAVLGGFWLVRSILILALGDVLRAR
jgi:hypothetical protein